jgi:hypothetical protein
VQTQRDREEAAHPLGGLEPPGGWVPKHDSGTIQLTVDGENGGPLELKPSQGGYAGEFTISNLGSDPLTVSRVALRGDADDVRLPPKFTVHFTDGGGTAGTIPGHASKKVSVIWVPDREPSL